MILLVCGADRRGMKVLDLLLSLYFPAEQRNRNANGRDGFARDCALNQPPVHPFLADP
jgi:hypothetical protein